MSELDDKLNKITTDKKLQSAIVEAVVHGKRPAGWSRKSGSPYYAEVYALQLKAEIDQMIIDRQPVIWDYDECFEKWGLSRNSLYLRINQSQRFLLDYLDPEKKYKHFFEMSYIERKRDTGIILSFKPEFATGDVSSFTARKIIPAEQVPKYLEAMREWLENSQVGGQPFEKEGLALNPEEIDKIKIEVAALPHVLSVITAHKIKLIKINLPSKDK